MEDGELFDWKDVWDSAPQMSDKWARLVLWRWHKRDGLIHIAKWRRQKYGPPRPVYRWGTGEDAARPERLTNAEVVRRYKKRLEKNDPDKRKAQTEKQRLSKRTTPILDPIHAALLGYTRRGNAWIKKMKAHTPIPRLNKAAIGSTVSVEGISRDMYVGKKDSDGYVYLWPHKDPCEAGRPWIHMAAGSIPARVVSYA